MNRPLSLLLGVVAVVVLSLMGLVVLPSWQYGSPKARLIEDETGASVSYPPLLGELEERGRGLYKAEGCIYCHSQQVRPEGFGVDIERALGSRRSVPLDYVHQAPPLLGTMRTGPDLSNIATRQPSANWHHLHLFDARIVSPGSIMPPFRYFYDVVAADPGAAGHALPREYFGHDAWIVPNEEGRALLAYIEALHQDHPLEAVQ
jgi:cytochrome c oxidase cbb3-type subunit 2